MAVSPKLLLAVAVIQCALLQAPPRLLVRAQFTTTRWYLDCVISRSTKT